MSEGGRRKQLLQLAAGAVFLAIAVVLVLIVVNASESDGGDTKLEGTREVNRSLKGIPQSGMVLGDPQAPVELVEFADLKCPYCKAFAEGVLPPIIENRVKKGQVKISYRVYTIIDDQSQPAGAAALAAGNQGRGWNFVELFYRNQGNELKPYADDAFLEAIAKGAGVKNLSRWNSERAELEPEIEATTAEAQEFGFTGTPSFAIKGPKTNGLQRMGTVGSTSDLETAIVAAAG
jgi:protein-disulfide isomerase